ncbi:MAG: hypothetical protein Q9182_007510 [Xanthomendoza sp. 2 TL-2023]
MGDRALMDDSGRVSILGRYKDIIVRGGENISPAALEACLNQHGGIKLPMTASGKARKLESKRILLVDSLTIMRFCYEVEKVYGKRLEPGEVRGNEIILKQARLLQGQAHDYGRLNFSQVQNQKATGPPSPQDMIPAFGSLASASKAAELATPALERLNLTWQDDVGAVYRSKDPAREFLSTSRRAVSFNLRWAYEIRSSTTNRLRQGLEEALTRHQTLRSLEVDTFEEVHKLIPDMNLEFAGPPDPAYRTVNIPIRTTSALGFIMTVHHSTFDAISMSAFIQGFDAILAGDGTQLREHTPF